jgi:hypothetical protein
MLSQVRSVDFGINYGGLGTVSYSLYSETNTLVFGPSSVGVTEVGTLTGIYSANISFPDDFHGTILWSSGGADAVFAAEQFNVEENNPKINDIHSTITIVGQDIAFIKDIEGGRWRIDKATSQMVFYQSDNTPAVATFQLKDELGNPSFAAPFERSRI